MVEERVAAILALSRADERRLAGMVWLARDCMAPGIGRERGCVCVCVCVTDDLTSNQLTTDTASPARRGDWVVPNDVALRMAD